MRFIPTPLKDAYLIELEKLSDQRGFFSRLFCSKEFKQHNIDSSFVQVNNSHSQFKGTLRGLHYQLPPFQETKIVRCIRGSFYDVILDIRPDSPTFGQSFGAELSAENRMMMLVPKGFAHGFLTLEDDSEVIYFVSEFYSKDRERGIRWNDPHFDIKWPFHPMHLSDRDGSHPDFNEEYHLDLSPVEIS